MNWENDRGYTINGTNNDSELDRVAIFVFRTKTGILWIDIGYLAPWNSSHASHQFDGVITEYEDRITFNNDRFNLVIEPMGDDKLKNEFEVFMKNKKTNYFAQRIFIKDVFKKDIKPELSYNLGNFSLVTGKLIFQ
ncbi:MAG: hypothetical protein K9L60_14105 [Methylovulum sp.]|jgi:hypothetical protein|nr:hypothetical protein [Methylovulum sp.]MCF8000075.1 hypothetical protein [Methylovulum sp.]